MSAYIDGDGETVGVCALCKPRAEASGWVPAGLAGTVSRPATERRRVNLGAGLRERIRRRTESPAAEPDPEPEPRVMAPLDVFNASHEARKVAGLSRSLGTPRATVRGNVITVAWDLSWYRWQVEGAEVTQTGKGTEIDELPADEKAWNATADPEGRLHVD